VSVQTTEIQPTAISMTTLKSEISEVSSKRHEAPQRKPDQQPSQEPSKTQEQPKLNVSAPNRQSAAKDVNPEEVKSQVDPAKHEVSAS